MGKLVTTNFNTHNAKQFVESINEPGKYYDTNNLFLRVYKAGSKNWVNCVNYLIDLIELTGISYSLV